jgi:Flp pilus assembly protein TadG
MMRKRVDTRSEEGTTAVEFALVAPVLLMFILFAMYGGFVVYYGAVADHVSRTVARQVAIPVGATNSTYPDQGSGGQSTVRAAANHAAGTLLPDPTSVTVTSSRGNPTPGDQVTVTVTYKPPVLSFLNKVMWFLPGGKDGISRTATERRE